MAWEGLLIDWLTLRFPLGRELGLSLTERIRDCMGFVVCTDADGVEKWRKSKLDVDALRSDTRGLMWQVQGDGKETYLTIGGSPASLMRGVNVFGSMDIQLCAETIIRTAQRALGAILPAADRWQCRRIDITGNYDLRSAANVKQALRALLATDGVRRKATSHKRGGDSVYWSPTSDLTKGKAYHKGPQLERLWRQGEKKISEEMIQLANRLLRLELTHGARWFRRLEEKGLRWLDLTREKLGELHTEFFGRMVGEIEVREMEQESMEKKLAEANAISQGRARAAYSTWLRIKDRGFEVTRESMPRATFYLHLKYLRGAGVSDGELCAGNVVPLAKVRILLASPVSSWEQLREAA